jgi:fibronectin-binding autotransporter adhesin
MKCRLNAGLSLLCALPVVFAAASASAAIASWSSGGANDNWTTPANWGGIAPVSGDNLIFGSGARTTPNNDFTAGTIFGNIAFTNGSPAFTLSGNAITLNNTVDAGLGNGTINNGGITNLSANAETVNLPILLGAGMHNIVTGTGAGQLNLSGAITRNPGAIGIFTKSGGNINVTGSGLATVNNILGAWSFIGGDWTSLDGSGNIIPLASGSYTAVAPGGNISSDSSQNIKISAATTTAITTSAGTVDVDAILYSAGGSSGTQNINPPAGATLRFGAKGGVYNATHLTTLRAMTIGSGAGVGTITAGGADGAAGELSLIAAPTTDTGANLTVNCVIADNIGGGIVSVNVLGYVVFAGNNTYSGGTYITKGRITVNTGSTAGASTAPIYVFPGGQLFDNNVNLANPLFIAGSGSTEANANAAMRANKTFSGTVTLMANARVGNGPTFTGKITGPGGLENGGGGSNVGGTTKYGNAANDYSGDTTINARDGGTPTAGGLQLNVSECIPNGAGKGNVIIIGGAATPASLNLNGNSETINGLSSLGTAANAFVTNSSATPVTLTVGDNNATSTFAGVISNNISLTKIGNGILTLSGTNNYNGATTVNGGKLATTTASGGAGSYSVADGAALRATLAGAGQSLKMSSLTLGTAGATTLQLDGASFALSPTVPIINITGALTVNGPVTLNLLGTSLAPGTYALINYGSESLGSTVTLVTSPRLSAVLADDNAGHITVTINSVDNAIKWDGTSANWDVNNSGNLNWKGVPSGTLTYYIEDVTGNDAVRFDNTASGTTTVNLTGTVAPATLTVTNPGVTYTFSGPGKITGSAALLKQDTGTLIINNGGSNDFTGGVTISGGAIQIGNNDANGNLPVGAVVNNGSLAINRSDTVVIANTISGTGSLVKNGNNTVTLSGANTYAGTTTINAGTVIVNNGSGTTLSSSVGALPGGAVTVVAGATLDIENGTANSIAFTNNNTFTAKQFNVAGAGVDGNGVIVNNGSVNQQSAFQNISLTGNATFGGLTRWDMRGNTTIVPQLNLNGFTLTKTNLVQISLVSVSVTPGNIDLKEGVLSFETASALNGPADGSQGTITVRPAGAFGHFRTVGGAITRPIVLSGGTITNLSTSAGGSTNDSPISLTANSTVAHASGSDLYIRGPISGAFGLTKLLTGTSLFAGTNIYTGDTIVGAGTLALTLTGSISNTANIIVSNGATLSASGRTDGTLWLSAGQTLKGNGGLAGTLTLGAGATLAPGFSVGALANTGAVTLQGGATNVVEVVGVSNAAAGVGYDTLTASGAITVQSTSLNPFRVKLVSLDGTGAAGSATNFDNTVTNYAWTIISGSSVAGFSADKFVVDESAFANALGGAHLVVKSTGTALQVALNHAPTANAAAYNRTGGQTLKILVANLATNWTDPDGNSLTLSSVSALSGNGFAVTTDGTNIFYSGSDNQNDSFTYTISDGFVTANGTVNVTAVAPAPAPANASLVMTNGGVPTITFAGIPGRTNVVQASSNLVDWDNISTNVAGTNGLWQVTDPAALSLPSRFYRSYQPYP